MSQTQETLEEAAESYVKQKWEYSQEGNKESFIAGSEWKARRMYSEEEVLKILELELKIQLLSSTPTVA
jgi:hypothetical protein